MPLLSINKLIDFSIFNFEGVKLRLLLPGALEPRRTHFPGFVGGALGLPWALPVDGVPWRQALSTSERIGGFKVL